MHASNSKLIFAATDLSNYLACTQLSLLDRQVALGGPKPPKFEDPGLEVIRQRGREHEQEYLRKLREDNGLDVVEIDNPGSDLSATEWWTRKASDTLEAMRSGVDAIYQGTLFDGKWLGLPDFLHRVESPSDMGQWAYEVVDAKLAREAKGGAVLQTCLYSDLLESAQGAAPERMHLALGGPAPRLETFRFPDYAAYYRSVKSRFETTIHSAEGRPPRAPDPVEHCRICAWQYVCDRERHDADHLSLVAGINGKQRRVLSDRGVTTMAGLSELPLPIRPRLDGVTDVAAERIREQARIQVLGRTAGAPRYELFRPPVEGEGLAALPSPSEGDLFFDIEADAYALGDGLEYLFGFVDGEGRYEALWALGRLEEKAMFESFIDFVGARLKEYPDLHVYHYAAYEPSALKRLAGRHATREDELDRLLRGKVFIDLYRVVLRALRASVESYSIKKLEQFYGFEREVELRAAGSALAHFEAWLELGGDELDGSQLLDQIQGYNKDDCVSTLRLRNWLEELRQELGDLIGQDLPRPVTPDPAASEAVTEEKERLAVLTRALCAGVPVEEEDRTKEDHARWLLAQLLGWHRREKKSMWWEYFRWLELSDEELVEDRSTLGGLKYQQVVDKVKRSEVYRYHYPRQEHDVHTGSRPVNPSTRGTAGEVMFLDEVRRAIDLKRAATRELPHPTALIPLEDVRDGVLRESLVRLAKAVIVYGFTESNPYRAAIDMLLRNPPRVGDEEGQALVRADERPSEAARRLIAEIDGSVLPIQGPPGAGKTYTGARMIVDLLAAGQRVGVTATSHKVIGNLLEEVCHAGRQRGVAISGIQKASLDQRSNAAEITAADDYGEIRAALDGDVSLAAGTAWLWSREDMAGSVDVLFIDEAGQLSLANALAVSQAAESVVLLGDPRQLEQPQRGVHPPGSDDSALEHILAGEQTVPPDRGVFLEQTWRLHPSICEFTSEVFYDGRLRSRPELEQQAVRGPEPINGTGLRLLAVDHAGNRNESEEEIEAVDALVRLALSGGVTWIDAEGVERPIAEDDILVVAPYNAQVSALATQLPQGTHVGTVDRFQGQQAPITIYSMASSSAADAPRDMTFLYSPNRLNVATSRARCLSIVVASPLLFTPDCRSPRQMKLANAFCRYRELAVDATGTAR